MISDYFNIETIFFCCLIIFIIFRLVLFFGKKTAVPTFSTIELPKKIQFQQKSDNEYGIGTFALDIVTIGGHGRLKEARFKYEQTYSVYVSKFNESIDIRNDINNNLNEVGRLTYNILLELEKSQKLLKQSVKRSRDNRSIRDLNSTYSEIDYLKNVAEEKSHTGIALIQGTTVGGLAAIGSWTLVSMFGTASTGTAIASLSGAAAHNSILAWFGGGAIAAGGGGMAAGTVVVGAIVALPIIFFSSYKTHSSATELDVKNEELASKIPELIEKNYELQEFNEAIESQLSILHLHYEKISKVNDYVYKIVYPNGKISKVKRNIKSFLNKDFYTKEEMETVDGLMQAIKEVNDLFQGDMGNSYISIGND